MDAVLRRFGNLCHVVGIYLQLLLGVHEPADLADRDTHGARGTVTSTALVGPGGRPREETRGRPGPVGGYSRQRVSHRDEIAWNLPREWHSTPLLDHAGARLFRDGVVPGFPCRLAIDDGGHYRAS